MVDEQNLSQSFRRIKADIMNLQGEILNIKEMQAHIAVELEALSKKFSTKKSVKKKSARKK